MSTGFNPRTHTGCDIEEGDIFIQGLFQSTHPHGVRRRTASISSRSPIVSIHAPTRGATRSVNFSMATLAMGFNPRTHTGCDLPGAPLPMDGELSFNPRTHTGCDKGGFCVVRLWSVSIHAPTRGATFAVLTKTMYQSVSIHAPTRGATPPETTAIHGITTVSIHAPTRGATFPKPNGGCFAKCFNPRTHTGCDFTRRICG